MVTVAQYLAHRLHALGARHLFGVPGDFSLSLLDSALGTGLLEWVGSPNELNAGYAADAYARTRGIGAMVTTFGVGELSAIDAVAGAYAENVPVVQVTGAPPTAAATRGALLHHTLGDGDFGRFARAYAEVTADGAVLTAEDAAERIDAVPARTIHLGVRTATVAGTEFPGVAFATGLEVLAGLMDGSLRREVPELLAAGPVAGAELDQETLWATLERRLPRGSRLVTDIGTCFWGAAGITLPAGVDVVAQPVWSSIGYALPATLCCALAAPDRRPVLVIGDGAAQMTVQELGTLARWANPVVVVVDNSGYTIERAL
jgi:TPP-dependent 2-oxoacid decarboxylase